MDKEIKERIAAINSGIIPEGYKKTKVGIVPVEWEEKKGIELFEYIRNGFVGTVSPFYVEKGHKYIQGNNIKGGKIVSDNLMYVNDEFYNSHKNSILKKGDIIIIQSGDVGKCALVTDEYENANCHALIIMTPYPETNTFFISYLLNSSVGFDMIKGFVTGNVLHHILASDYKELKYVIPPLPEQQKIAEILSTQDKLIELQEKKIEQLKELKKAYLQKMFPQKGSKYPELRFKGFTEPWEQRKLGEVLSLLKDGTHGTHQNSDEGVYLLSAKNIKNGQIVIDEETDRKISIEEYETIHSNFKLKKDDVLLTIVGSIGETAILKNPDIATFQRSVAFLRPNKDTISIFLKTEIDTDIFQKELADRKSQSAQPGVYLGELEKIPFYITSIQEQQKIGTFFSNLDTLITLHQRKSEQEKQKKKALMQLLLTGIVRTK